MGSRITGNLLVAVRDLPRHCGAREKKTNEYTPNVRSSVVKGPGLFRIFKI